MPLDPVLLVVDDRGVVTAANANAGAFFGRAVVGCSVDDVVRGADGGADGFAHSGRGVVVTAGERVVVDVVVSGLDTAAGGALAGARSLLLWPVGVGREQVRQMAATVGHGLRNPLGAVRNGWFYVAKKVRDSEVAHSDARVTQFLEIVDLELKRCAQVVADLFDFAELRAPQRAPVRLRSLVDGVAADLGLAVANDVDGDLPLVSVDAAQLRQALTALVQNGFDAAGPGARVVVTAAVDGADLVVDVSDNGPGVAVAERARLFDPLYTTKLKGAGLGLALVDAVARAHGGSASVADHAGGGAVFRLRLGAAVS